MLVNSFDLQMDFAVTVFQWIRVSFSFWYLMLWVSSSQWFRLVLGICPYGFSVVKGSDILVLKIILVLVFIQFWVNNFYFSFSFSCEIILVYISVSVSVLK